ncbi:MAG: hypothetical protein R6U31_00515 [bacterium]
MKYFMLLTVIAVLAVSCSLGSMPDEENVALLINSYRNTFFANYAFGEKEEPVKSPINALSWYRAQRDTMRRSMIIDIENDSAFVTVKNIIPGYLNINYVNDSLDTVMLQKAYDDTIVRYAHCIKDTVKNHFGGWRMESVSSGIVQGDSLVAIDSVKLSADSYIDTIIDNPAAAFKLDNMITLPPGIEIEVTVYSASTEQYFVHHDKRRGEAVNGAISFKLSYFEGYNSITPDIVTGSSINTDDSDYISEMWILPLYIEE